MAKAVILAKERGLTIPILYNSSGYDSIETLRLLEGIVDIYMPDAKYSDNAAALKYSNANNYWDVNQKAIVEMYRQVGRLTLDNEGIAVKGLIIGTWPSRRHCRQRKSAGVHCGAHFQ